MIGSVLMLCMFAAVVDVPIMSMGRRTIGIGMALRLAQGEVYRLGETLQRQYREHQRENETDRPGGKHRASLAESRKLGQSQTLSRDEACVPYRGQPASLRVRERLPVCFAPGVLPGRAHGCGCALRGADNRPRPWLL